MKWFINTVPTILSENRTIQSTLDFIHKNKNNYILVSNSRNIITRILTSDEIQSVNNVKPQLKLKDLEEMPLVFACLNNLKTEVERIKDLHGLKYIPVFRSNVDHSLSNLVGVLDLTELK